MNDVNEPDHGNDISAAGDTLEVPIRDEMIRLGQLLKLAGVVDDGAQARALIEDGQVRVDGEVERRRGRQVRPGSSAELGGTRIRVTSA
ncbi:MAG: RNA-binding S4 domain-containing protein [Dermatophilaceae bacterium]